MSDGAAIATHFGVARVPALGGGTDIRPGGEAPIVRLARAGDPVEPGTRVCAPARWGLVPAWSTPASIGLSCVIARAELIDRLPAYRSAYRQRRCLVPVNAYFEWSGVPLQSPRWRIGLEDRRLFAFAGLWERWVDPRSGATTDSFAILTCRAKAPLSQVRARMPVIVAPEHYATWLDAHRDPSALLARPTSEALQAEPATC